MNITVDGMSCRDSSGAVSIDTLYIAFNVTVTCIMKTYLHLLELTHFSAITDVILLGEMHIYGLNIKKKTIYFNYFLREQRIVNRMVNTRWTPSDEWMLDTILCTFY